MALRACAVLSVVLLFAAPSARAWPPRNQDGGGNNGGSVGDFFENLWDKFKDRFTDKKPADPAPPADSGGGSSGGGRAPGQRTPPPPDPTPPSGGASDNGNRGPSAPPAATPPAAIPPAVTPPTANVPPTVAPPAGVPPPVPPPAAPPPPAAAPPAAAPPPPTNMPGTAPVLGRAPASPDSGTSGTGSKSPSGGGAGGTGAPEVIHGFKGLKSGTNSDPIAEAQAAAAAQAASAEDQRILRTKVGAFAPPEPVVDPVVKAAALINSTRSKLDLGDRAEAIRDATAALALVPGSPAALGLRATALNLSGRNVEAARDAREALKVRPDEGALWENLAWAALRTKDYAESVKAADMALKINPKSALALSTRGYAKQMLGDMKGLREDLEAAAALDSRFAEKAALARAGKRAYDPNADDASYLLGAAATVAAGAVKSGPILVGAGLAMFVGLATLIGYAFSRRSAAPVSLQPLAQAPAPAPKGNGLLAGKYRLEGLVGKGGMGEVRRAKDTTLGRPVAIKTLVSALDQEGAPGDEWRARLRKEAMTVAAVHHPGIVDIYEIVEEDDALHLVFEYLEGITVHSMIAQQKQLTPAHCARLLAPVCDALSHAHSQGLVHRDLKPGNIMVTSTGHVKLLDFGIARAQGEVVTAGATAGPAGLRFDRTTTVAGTPVYMSPESDQGLVGPAGDVYSLGVCLYEMLTGRRPYPDTATTVEKTALQVAPPSALAPGVPQALDALVASAMAFEPSARPASAEAFKDALAAATRGL